jgi:hypothetical protein
VLLAISLRSQDMATARAVLQVIDGDDMKLW